jgi:hypothetical protein
VEKRLCVCFARGCLPFGPVQNGKITLSPRGANSEMRNTRSIVPTNVKFSGTLIDSQSHGIRSSRQSKLALLL